MKRESMLMISVYDGTQLTSKARYCVGASLGKEKRFTKWSSNGMEPKWNDGLYFMVSYEKASSRRDGLCLYLYKRSIFGIKRVVAKHEFDPGRINLFEPTGPIYLDFMTMGKKPSIYGRVKVKVQFVKSSDYFTCPNCPRLTDHVPAFLLGNIYSVSPAKEGIFKKEMHVVMKCGSAKDTTPKTKDGQIEYHFLVDKKDFVNKKEIKFDIYKVKKCLGTCSVKIDDLMEGNVCEKTLELKKGKKRIAQLVVYLQSIYECCDCIIEREDEDGNMDIPVKRTASTTSSTPAVLPSAECIGAIPGMTPSAPVVPTPTAPVTPVAPVAIIPGMSTTAMPAPASVVPTASMSGMSGMSTPVAPSVFPAPTSTPTPMVVPIPVVPQPGYMPQLQPQPQPQPQPVPIMSVAPMPVTMVPQPSYSTPYGGVYSTPY